MRHPATRGERWLAVALVALAVACGRSDPPRLEVRPRPADATASSGMVGYQLRNVGGRPLALDGLTPACGCAATARLPEVLAPGASTTLTVRCRPSRTTAQVVRELRLRSSDPSNPETVLRVTLPGVGAGPEPAALYFGYVPVGESVWQDVVLPAAIAAESVRGPLGSELGIEPMPARADGARGVRVRFTPRVAGVVRTTIDLGAAGGALPVVAVAYDGVLAFPAEVGLSRASGGAGLPVITLVGLGAEPLAITHVDYPPGLGGELRMVVPGREFRLVLRARGRIEAGGAAAIRLRRGPGDPVLTIPVVGSAAGDPAGPAA
jgi:hypothetical protein